MGGIGVLLRFEKQPDSPEKLEKLHRALWKRVETRLRDALISGLTRSILVHYISEQTYEWFDDPSDGVFAGVCFSFRDGGDDFPMKYASYHWTERACVDPAVFADLQEIAKRHDAELAPRTWRPPETIYFALDGGDALASIYDNYLDVWTNAGLVRIDFAECPILDYVNKLVAEQRCLCEVCRKSTDKDPGPILDAETLAGIAWDIDVPDAPELFVRLDEAIGDPDLALPVDEIAALSGIARRKAELLIAIGFEDDHGDERLPEALVKLGARWAAPVLFGPAIYNSTSYDVREALRASMRALLVNPPVYSTVHAMGSLPFVLEVVLPRSGAVPPNSPIVLQGHIQGQLAVTARAAGVDLGIVLEDPPAFGPHTPGTYRTWLVRPTASEWPAGATVVITAVREPQEPAVIEVPIAEGRDVSPPVFSSMSLPERKVFGGPRQPSREVVVLAHQGFTDDASPLILVTLEAGGAVLRGTTLEGIAGGLPMPPGGAPALDAITLADLAGNSVRITNPCSAATTEEGPPPPIAAFTCVAGTLVAEDGWLVGTTDAGTENGFSRGHYRATSAPDGDVAISVTAMRLTDEPAMPIEIAFRGGFFGVTTTSLWYLYEHDGHWTGWKPTPSPVGSDPLTLRVVQRGADIQAFVNGELAGSMTLEKPSSTSPIGVFFKGPPGTTARMRFRDFVAAPAVR